MTTLDIRDCKLIGNDLKLEIVNRVKETQRLVLQPLPDMLILTKVQYEDLEDDPRMMPMYASKARIYITSENAMELDIREI